MFRFNRVVCALAVCVAVGAALGAAVKIKVLDTSMGLEGPDADGMIILNYNQGQDETIVQLAITNFTPNTNYLFTLESASHCLRPGGGVITNDQGHATLHMTIPALPPILDCPAEGGDWSDADVIFRTGSDDGPVHAIGWNPS